MSQTSILDSREEIAKLDKSNMLGSIEALGLQIKHAWHDTQSIEWHPSKPIQNVVVSGMGGSGLGADVIKNVFKPQLAVPFDFVHDYTLPNYVNENSLVILSSYSGNTEETLACGEDALQRGAQVMVITAGGKLKDMAEKNNWPIYLIDPQFNPCGQPRMAIGYSVFGTIGLCAKAGIIKIEQTDLDLVEKTIADQVSACTVEVAADHNPGKILAFSMLDRKTILVGAEFLAGAVHTSTNQANENAKAWTDYLIIPEINHHLMEGLRFSGGLQHSAYFIFFQSKLYHSQTQKRFPITQAIFEEAGYHTLSHQLTATTPLAQVFETITLMAYANFYLSMLEGIDPSPIPIVEAFKTRLV